MTGEDANGCERRLARIENLLHEISEEIHGQAIAIALQKQRVEALPSPSNIRFHASIGGGVIMFLGMLGYAIIKIFTFDHT